MILPRKNEAEAEAFRAFLQSLRRQRNLDAEGLENIGAATARGHAAVTMLDDGYPTPGQDKHDRRRNIEKIEPVAARATDVDHGPRKVLRIDQRIDRAIDQLLDESDDLFDALPLIVEGD